MLDALEVVLAGVRPALAQEAPDLLRALLGKLHQLQSELGQYKTPVERLTLKQPSPAEAGAKGAH